MIARHEQVNGADTWSRLAATLPPGVIAWRQDGRAVQRDGKYFARFVCYIEAGTVRERLDSVVPGEWDLTLEALPPMANYLMGDVPEDAFAFKARLHILGVIREDVGMGKDYKSAATDAFKRAAVRFGVGHELYQMEQLWVQVDGDGKYARPLEDPAAAYERKYGRPPGVTEAAAELNERDLRALREEDQQRRPAQQSSPVMGYDNQPDGTEPQDAEQRAPNNRPSAEPSCPKCGGRMWDNRATKRNPRAPDYKCRSRTCDGVIWPPKAEPIPSRPGDPPPPEDPDFDESQAHAFIEDLPF